MHDTTRLIHNPPPPDGFASLSPPVHRASTLVFPTLAAFEARHTSVYDGYSYGLYGTPTTRALELQIADIEGARRALVTPSGLSAIALTCFAFASRGDRILMPASMYGPALRMGQELLAPLGIQIGLYEPLIGADVAGRIDRTTRLVWVESPGSLTFEVQDVPAIARAARKAGALVAADNTWATPLLYKPLDLGADITMQSLSKYASGHSDLLMGSLATRDEALFRRLKDVAKMLGLGVSGDDCFLCGRGLKTLNLRLQQSGKSARQIADWLAGQPMVAQILHPALPGHPGHESWKRDFKGAAGVFAIVLAPAARDVLERAVAALRLFQIGASWGGAHSLMAPGDPRPGRSDLTWLKAGQLIRIAIGLEDPADLIADLDRFLRVIAANVPSPSARDAESVVNEGRML